MRVPTEITKIATQIKNMEIRGAGKIARSSAEALRIMALKTKASSRDKFLAELHEIERLLLNTRPTSVSLPNALRFILYRVETSSERNVGKLKEMTINIANNFIQSSLKAVETIGKIGARRIQDKDRIITHCHSLAVLSILRIAHREGKRIEVLVTETRPRYQGRITAKKLSEDGIPTTLIIDSAARYFIREVNKAIVGADSIAANGAVINKIGTSQLALVAHEARVPFFVAAETYKFHPGTALGELVPIEERKISEIINENKLPNVKVRNPVFDVTPPEYIDLIITERGVFPPQAAFLIIRDLFGYISASEIKTEW